MPERTGREWAQGFQAMLANRDFDRLPDFIHADCVHDYPQSGERSVGLANSRSVLETYPGGRGRAEAESLDVAGDDRRWAMAPNFTLVAVTGSGSTYSSVIRARYPDDSVWYVVTMFELDDGKQRHASLFFAPFFEAPEWRRPYVESQAASAS